MAASVAAALKPARSDVVPRAAAVVGAGDGQALRAQPLEVRALVRKPTRAQVFDEHVAPDRPLDLATRRAQVERGEMTAAQEVAEVGRGAEQAGGGLPHGCGAFGLWRFIVEVSQSQAHGASLGTACPGVP